jgi:hypothetical protein
MLRLRPTIAMEKVFPSIAAEARQRNSRLIVYFNGNRAGSQHGSR